MPRQLHEHALSLLIIVGHTIVYALGLLNWQYAHSIADCHCTWGCCCRNQVPAGEEPVDCGRNCLNHGQPPVARYQYDEAKHKLYGGWNPLQTIVGTHWSMDVWNVTKQLLLLDVADSSCHMLLTKALGFQKWVAACCSAMCLDGEVIHTTVCPGEEASRDLKC